MQAQHRACRGQRAHSRWTRESVPTRRDRGSCHQAGGAGCQGPRAGQSHTLSAAGMTHWLRACVSDIWVKHKCVLVPLPPRGTQRTARRPRDGPARNRESGAWEETERWQKRRAPVSHGLSLYEKRAFGFPQSSQDWGCGSRKARLNLGNTAWQGPPQAKVPGGFLVEAAPTLVFFVFVFGCAGSCCCLVAKLCPTLCDPIDCSPPGFSVHGISQAKILEWVAISFSRGSSWPGDRTRVSCIGRQVLYSLSPQKSHLGSARP